MSQIHLPPEHAWTFARLPDILGPKTHGRRSVLHVGAHHGEEVDIYRQCRFDRIALVEPDPRSVTLLRERFGDDPAIHIEACAATTDTDVAVGQLHRAIRSVWSGLHRHATATGETDEVQLRPIVDLVAAHQPTLLVLDTQGTELDLLRAVDLSALDHVIIETTRRIGDTAAVYANALRYMQQQGWRLVEEWVHDNSGYTDCVFTR